MKVVLFCGGQGLRMREFSGSVPKPMATIGSRPVLWHVMRYYAHFGHRDFVLCLGYRGDVIKDYFLHYDETVSNDFVLADGGKSIELLNADIQDWRIAFVDTGPDASVGQRLLAVKSQLVDEPMFLANYADGLTDAPLGDLVEDFSRRGKVAGFGLAIPRRAEDDPADLCHDALGYEPEDRAARADLDVVGVGANGKDPQAAVRPATKLQHEGRGLSHVRGCHAARAPRAACLIRTAPRAPASP